MDDESALIAALRAGDPTAFARLLDLHTPAMLRVARRYVSSHGSAEEAVSAGPPTPTTSAWRQRV